MIQQLDLMVREGFLKQENRNMVLVSNSIEDLIEKMNNYKAPKMTKIVNYYCKAMTINCKGKLFDYQVRK